MVTIPEVAQMSRTEAEDALSALGLTVSTNVKYEMTDDIAAGLIVKVTPSSGTQIEKGSLVKLTISKGMYFVIGNYVNQKIEAVELLLEGTKVTIRKQFDFDSTAAEGTVLKQEYLVDGDKIDPNMTQEIKLTIAGKVQFTIPNLVGYNVLIAQAQLVANGAVVTLKPLDTTGMTPDQIAALSKNTVISMSPAANTYYIQTSTNSITLYYYADATS